MFKVPDIRLFKSALGRRRSALKVADVRCGNAEISGELPQGQFALQPVGFDQLSDRRHHSIS